MKNAKMTKVLLQYDIQGSIVNLFNFIKQQPSECALKLHYYLVPELFFEFDHFIIVFVHILSVFFVFIIIIIMIICCSPFQLLFFNPMHYLLGFMYSTALQVFTQSYVRACTFHIPNLPKPRKFVQIL